MLEYNFNLPCEEVVQCMSGDVLWINKSLHCLPEVVKLRWFVFPVSPATDSQTPPKTGDPADQQRKPRADPCAFQNLSQGHSQYLRDFALRFHTMWCSFVQRFSCSYFLQHKLDMEPPKHVTWGLHFQHIIDDSKTLWDDEKRASKQFRLARQRKRNTNKVHWHWQTNPVINHPKVKWFKIVRKQTISATQHSTKTHTQKHSNTQIFVRKKSYWSRPIQVQAARMADRG